MKTIIIGGSGFIGRKLVVLLRQQGHDVVAASPSLGVNVITGEGLVQALTGAQVVVDVSNPPSFDDIAVLKYFEKSGRNLLPLEASLGIKHHIALSVVGTERLLTGGYFRAKLVQENLIKASPVPYTIVRATQFFEYLHSIAQSATDGQIVRLPPVLIQPIASDDVVASLSQIVIEKPLNTTIELAGPDRFLLDELIRQYLIAKKDMRIVTTDVKAGYFGSILVNNQSLIPGDNARLCQTRFQEWLSLNA